MSANHYNLQQFKNLVGIKFQLYNSLFTSLPFHRIENTGFLIPILLLNCEEGYKNGLSPRQIIDQFFERQTGGATEEQQLDLLFRLTQYIERQVVLFDALEDAAFKELHDLSGMGTLKHLALEVEDAGLQDALAKKLQHFCAQLVLTAHPTQFYRGTVLGIIHDLSHAIKANNENLVYTYLQQLGRTPFYQQVKPTPYDEAVTLIWYLENVFYTAMGKIVGGIRNRFPHAVDAQKPVIKMGFWPGGDRDGNPFVNADTTLKVAAALRQSAIKCYYMDVRKLKRRLTFKGVDVLLAGLEKKLYSQLFLSEQDAQLSKEEILKTLHAIRYQLIQEHNGLFEAQVAALITRVELFGLHFAGIDIRQDSSIHQQLMDALSKQHLVLPANYTLLNDAEKIEALLGIGLAIDAHSLPNEVLQDCVLSVKAIGQIQAQNGEQGCHRYIISHTNSAVNVMEVMALFVLAGWKPGQIAVDIVPLFETIEDLEKAAGIMEQLYSNTVYRHHLKQRNNKQTIMLGFSDGTKDGGYLMANWSIYKAKEQLSLLSAKFGLDVLFFDGRGGPPARGGGKTHNFYASLGPKISGSEIQLTVQGQTVSSNFGTVDAAQYNIEQLLHAGIAGDLFATADDAMPASEYALINSLAAVSFDAYSALKNHPHFTSYLLHASPLRFYADTNIGSRPASRGTAAKLALSDLRAIPFVGAWSQIKQNVTGYYGVGTALEALANKGKWMDVKNMYTQSLFFRTLIDNCEMAMKKSFFPLTAYLQQHPQYGEIWQMLYDEYERSKKYIFLLTGKQQLMASHPVDQLSIQMRERIVLPLLSIQQYALTRLREMEDSGQNETTKAAFEKLVMRCSFGIINSGRNSA